MAQDDRKEEDVESSDENEVAIALVAECQVGDKKYSAGETWTDEQDECRMSICNPGGVVSYLECPRFDVKEDDKACVRIPGDNKYAYPHCCDYVFRTKGKKLASGQDEKKEEEIKESGTTNENKDVQDDEQNNMESKADDTEKKTGKDVNEENIDLQNVDTEKKTEPLKSIVKEEKENIIEKNDDGKVVGGEKSDEDDDDDIDFDD